MATFVFRTAAEIQDGDEFVVASNEDQEHLTAVVVEKSLDEDDNVTLLIKVSPDVELVTKLRPRETVTPFETVPAECGPADE